MNQKPLCPLCNLEMELSGEDETSSSKTDKKYKRTVYVCKKDDAWVTIEIPLKEK